MFNIRNSFFSTKSLSNIKNLSVNFGPQHPAAHGVLRLALQLDNERIIRCEPHIGLLHRGTEALICQKPWLLSLPYFDRLDYVSMLAQEHAYCLSIESLTGTNLQHTNVPMVRTLFDELTRILNHLLAIACHALDVGSMSSIFWLFEERERVMEFYERISGARMHAAYYLPIHQTVGVSTTLLTDILNFNLNLKTTLSEVNGLLLKNKIWKTRLINVGVLTVKEAQGFGLTGVLARSVGHQNDCRLGSNHFMNYGIYNELIFNSYIGHNGDSYTRYVLRMYEMLEATTIIKQVIQKISTSSVLSILNNTRYFKMSQTINDFKKWTGGCLITGSCSHLIESPKGAFSVYVHFRNSNIPVSCKIRSPSYHSLSWLKHSLSGLMLADLITMIGTIDIVFGEIDR